MTTSADLIGLTSLELMVTLRRRTAPRQISTHRGYIHSQCARLSVPAIIANPSYQTLLYLLRRSYACIYSCMISSEPVSEALLPVFNQLQTLRRCLLEVKRSGGVSSPREMYPYTMKVGRPFFLIAPPPPLFKPRDQIKQWKISSLAHIHTVNATNLNPQNS